MQTSIEQLAELVALNADESNDSFSIDPMTIMIIIQLIQAILPILQERCNKDSDEINSEAESIVIAESYRDRRQARRKKRFLKILAKRELREDYDACDGDICVHSMIRVAADPANTQLIAEAM